MLKIIHLLVVFSLHGFAFGNGAVYIDPSYKGNYSDGTIHRPFISWNSVIWESGTRYLQKAGTTFFTNESLKINNKHNITIGTYGDGSRPHISNSGMTNLKVIEITDCNNIVISGMEVSSIHGNALAAIIINGVDSFNNLIDNCLLRDVQWGIRLLSSSKGNRILNCIIYNTQDDGIFIKDVIDIEIAYCHIYNVNLKFLNNSDENYAAGDNIQIASKNEPYLLIHHNILDHSYTGNKFCLIAWGRNYSGLLEYNTFIGNNKGNNSCLYLSPTSGSIIIRYNSFINGNYGIFQYVQHLYVNYNKFVNNNIAISLQDNVSLVAQNNIFYNNLIYSITSKEGTSITSNNNIFFINGESKVYFTNGSISSNYNIFNIQTENFLNGISTLLSWQLSTGQDLNSLIADPEFQNPLGLDFSIKHNSPCIDAGTYVGLDMDFFGSPVTKDNGVDIGYHEFMKEKL